MVRRGKAGALIALLAGAAGLSFAARPLIIDDADPLAFQHGKFEAGGWHEKENGCHHWDWPIILGYGLIPGLEVNLGLGGTFQQQLEVDESGVECIHSESGIGDLILNTKWRFLEETKWIPRQAIVPAVKFPTADKNKGLGSGKIDYDLTWLASKSLGEKAGGHVNLGYALIGEPDGKDAGDIIHYGIALDYKIADPFQWVGEIYAAKELMRGTEQVIMFNTGLRWTATAGLVLDAAAGSHLTSAGPGLTATFGLTWTFGVTRQAGK